MDLGLTGKRALVTGSTRGVGRAIAEQLLGEGASVAICSRDPDNVARAVAELGRGGTVVGSAVDVGDIDALTAWVDDSATHLGGIDIYVHATTATLRGDDSDWTANVDIDLLALVHGVTAAAERLEDGGGAVIAVGTVAAAESFLGGSTSYSAVKAAALNWTLGQAQVLGARGVRCNVVSPGPTMVDGGTWDRMRTESPLIFASAQQRHPGGDLGTPDDVARAVTFLASDAARHINGVNLTVDGGFLNRVDY